VAVIGGMQRIVIIISDDGSRKARRHANYVVLVPDQLKTAP
jgi:hypothetical protein